MPLLEYELAMFSRVKKELENLYYETKGSISFQIFNSEIAEANNNVEISL